MNKLKIRYGYYEEYDILIDCDKFSDALIIEKGRYTMPISFLTYIKKSPYKHKEHVDAVNSFNEVLSTAYGVELIPYTAFEIDYSVHLPKGY